MIYYGLMKNNYWRYFNMKKVGFAVVGVNNFAEFYLDIIKEL